jgi:fumarate reductase subunit C
MPNGWWLRNPFYTRYMIREGTSILVGIYTVVLLVGLIRLYQGEVAFNGWLEALKSPVSIVFSLVALAAAAYHTYTWFAIAPKAMRIQLGSNFVDGKLITAAHYAGAVVVSVFVLIYTWAV